MALYDCVLAAMLNRYWRSICVAFGGLALFAVLSVGGYQIYEASEQQHSSYSYQPAANPRGVIFAPAKTPAHPYQPHCYNPQKNEQADLCAQWAAVEQVGESNRMTSLNLKFGIFSLFFTVIGTGLIVWTFAEQRATSRRELRAYVFPDTVGIFALTDQNPTSENGKVGSNIVLKNSGQTPAYEISHWCTLCIHPVAEEHTLIPPKGGGLNSSAMPPDGMIHALRRMKDKIKAADIRRLKSGELAFFVWGRIEYKDAFGKGRFTEYRFAYSAWPLRENLTMSIALGGNSAN